MTQEAAPVVLEVSIRDATALHSAYMSFLKNGGLFVPTQREMGLGQEVLLLLTLMDEAEKLPIAGKIVWLTPPGAQGNRQAGIGVEFSEQDAAVGAKIENYLGGALASERPTHTL